MHLQAFTLFLSLPQEEGLFHTRCDRNHLDLPQPTTITQTGNKQTGLIQCMIHPLRRLQCAWKCSLLLRHQGEGQSITHQPTQSRLRACLNRNGRMRWHVLWVLRERSTRIYLGIKDTDTTTEDSEGSDSWDSDESSGSQNNWRCGPYRSTSTSRINGPYTQHQPPYTSTAERK